MKQLTSDLHDAETLQNLGRASVQIVHDLKNQLNGLKLYATFLRKRMEKSERPADEQETVAKLIAGLERAATDMTTLVRYGRPVELRRQPHTDLVKIINTVLAREGSGAINLETQAESLAGEFDAAALTEAFQAITIGALIILPTPNTEATSLTIRLSQDQPAGDVPPDAVVEWHGVQTQDADTDPFHSFAGSNGLRLSLAAKIIEAHDGTTGYEANILRVRLPFAAESKSPAE
ncbi:MAG: hypothetical protein ABR577_14060 [Pyrinomonadaceae bacterium]